MTRIIDRYVAKSFLVGYLIAFGVLIGLRIIIDLFVNLDEFAENAQGGVVSVLANIFTFYGTQATLYFRDFAGMITVVAAAFSLGKMTRANELTAVLASGVSLKRVIAPILFLALVLTGFLIIDQEILIPNLAENLVQDHDEVGAQKRLDFWFLSDGNGSLISAADFNPADSNMLAPVIITRKKFEKSLVWEVTGRITADSAVYDPLLKQWNLINGSFLPRLNADYDSTKLTAKPEIDAKPLAFYKSDLTPRDIPILRKEEYKSMLSSSQLAALAARPTQIKDMAQLYSQKHFRITDPIINFIMLMVGLPALVCREPKMMKSAILKSFSITAACFLTTFAAKMVATEYMFSWIRPEFWAWLPIFIFLPIAFLELDSMQT